MNKKIVAIATSLVVGGGVLMGTAYANASSMTGYESYKSAIKETKNLKNETVALKISVTDTGKELVNVDSNIKINLATSAMSQATTVKSTTGSQTFSNYNQAGKSVSKSSDSEVYNVRENSRNNFNKKAENMNPEIAKSVETVVDTLVGNMKNNVTVTNNADGAKTVAIKLNENEIVPLVNAVTSMAMTKGNDEPMMNEKAGKMNFKNLVPQLTSDIKVTSVDVTGDINKDNTIKDQTAKIMITGKDAQGKLHEITINATLNLTNINSTTPDTVDLTGKQVKTMTNEFRGRD